MYISYHVGLPETAEHSGETAGEEPQVATGGEPFGLNKEAPVVLKGELERPADQIDQSPIRAHPHL
jgi:hypothetical protein